MGAAPPVLFFRSKTHARGDVSDKSQQDNVIHVNFGQPSEVVSQQTPAQVETIGQAPDAFEHLPEDPLGAKKLEVFEQFIARGMVSVTFDTQAQGVDIPVQFRTRPRLMLNFSHKFFIEDFHFDAIAVCASLSFGGQPYFCVIPWGAVSMLLCREDNAVAVFGDV